MNNSNDFADEKIMDQERNHLCYHVLGHSGWFEKFDDFRSVGRLNGRSG